jgi:hypothetical protein
MRIEKTVTIEQAALWDRVKSQLKDLETEMASLSKKKPDGAINTFKLSLINEKLVQANQILSNEDRPFAEFEVFTKDAMPTNSDVVIVITQYLNRLGSWRADHVRKDGYDWVWNFESEEEELTEEEDDDDDVIDDDIIDDEDIEDDDIEAAE